MPLFRIDAEIDDDERLVITIVGVVAVVIGVLGGFALYVQLDGEKTVQAGFWTTLLTVSALSALPLVAMTTHVSRLWLGSATWGWRWLAPFAILSAVAVALVGVVLSLYQIAVTGGSGNPHDRVLLVATSSAGAALGAAVFGVAAAIVDKIDVGSKPKDPPQSGHVP